MTKVYSTKDIKISFGNPVHEDHCQLLTYDVKKYMECTFDELPDYTKSEFVAWAESVAYLDENDNLVATQSTRTNTYKKLNPLYKEPVCTCNPAMSDVEELVGFAEDTFVTISPKIGEETYDHRIKT